MVVAGGTILWKLMILNEASSKIKFVRIEGQAKIINSIRVHLYIKLWGI
jgi:hypothetical protein